MVNRKTLLAGAVVWTLLSLPFRAAGQSNERAAEIRSEFGVTLGDREGPGIIPGMVRSVARDNRGDFWVSVYEAEPPVVYSPGGDFLFIAGRAGEGPGEINGEAQVVPAVGDSVFVLDSGNGRLNSLDLSGAYLNSMRLVSPGARDYAVFPDGKVVVNASFPTRSQAGFPLHLFLPGSAGSELSFGARVPIVRPGSPRDWHRAVAVDDQRRILALKRNEPILEFWAETGEYLETWELEAPWFRPPSPSTNIETERHPQPQFLDVLPAGDLIWVSALIPEDDWEQGFVLGKDARGVEAWVMDDASKVFDTIVLAIETDGDIRGIAKLDEPAPILLGDGYLATLETYEEGHPVVRIWRLYF